MLKNMFFLFKHRLFKTHWGKHCFISIINEETFLRKCLEFLENLEELFFRYYSGIRQVQIINSVLPVAKGMIISHPTLLGCMKLKNRYITV